MPIFVYTFKSIQLHISENVSNSLITHFGKCIKLFFLYPFYSGQEPGQQLEGIDAGAAWTDLYHQEGRQDRKIKLKKLILEHLASIPPGIEACCDQGRSHGGGAKRATPL